jgi:hypothetical protein
MIQESRCVTAYPDTAVWVRLCCCRFGRDRRGGGGGTGRGGGGYGGGGGGFAGSYERTGSFDRDGGEFVQDRY